LLRLRLAKTSGRHLLAVYRSEFINHEVHQDHKEKTLCALGVLGGKKSNLLDAIIKIASASPRNDRSFVVARERSEHATLWRSNLSKDIRASLPCGISFWI